MFVRHTTIRWAQIVALGLLLTWPLFNTYGLKAQAAPALTIVSPVDGATVDGPVTIHVQHSGIVFDGVKIGQAPEPGVGHWHVNVDGQYAGLAVSNVLEIPNDTFPTISAGEHTITVDLHQNNHAATNPPVEESFQINLSQDLTPGTGSSQGASSSGSVDNQQAATATVTGHSTLPTLPNTGAGSTGLGGMGCLTMMALSGVLLLLCSALVMWRRTTRGHSGRQH